MQGKTLGEWSDIGQSILKLYTAESAVQITLLCDHVRD